MATEGLDVTSSGRMKAEGLGFVQPASAPPTLTTEPAPQTPTTSDEDRELTDEDYNAYLDQVRKSDGFDVETLPRCSLLSAIQPANTDSLPLCFDLKVHSQHALDEYNRRFQGKLEFVKILKVMGRFVRYFQFYITLEAKDLADGGSIKTYQTLVMEVEENDYYVSSFRLKPPEDEQVVMRKIYKSTKDVQAINPKNGSGKIGSVNVVGDLPHTKGELHSNASLPYLTKGTHGAISLILQGY